MKFIGFFAIVGSLLTTASAILVTLFNDGGCTLPAGGIMQFPPTNICDDPIEIPPDLLALGAKITDMIRGQSVQLYIESSCTDANPSVITNLTGNICVTFPPEIAFNCLMIVGC